MRIEDIAIDPELETFLPDDQSFEALEAEIVADGEIHEPLIVWQHHGILIDGHRRLRVWREHQDEVAEPEIVEKTFPDMRAVRSWMIEHQLSRRNITPQQATELRGRLLLEMRKPHGGQERFSSENSPSHQNDALDESASKEPQAPAEEPNQEPDSAANRKTAARVAEKTGVSQATVERDAAYVESLDAIAAVNAKFADDLRAGRVRVSKADVTSIGKLHPDSMGPALLNIRQGRKWFENGKAEGSQMRSGKTKPTPHDIFKPLIDELGKAVRACDAVAKVTGGQDAHHEKIVGHLGSAMNVVKAWKESQ